MKTKKARQIFIVCVGVIMIIYVIIFVNQVILGDSISNDMKAFIDKIKISNIVLGIPMIYKEDVTLYYFQRSLCLHLFYSNVKPRKVFISMDNVIEMNQELRIMKQLVMELNKYLKGIEIVLKLKAGNVNSDIPSYGENRNNIMKMFRKTCKNNHKECLITEFDYDDIPHPQRLELLDYIYKNIQDKSETSIIHKLVYQPTCVYNGSLHKMEFITSIKKLTFNNYINKCKAYISHLKKQEYILQNFKHISMANLNINSLINNDTEFKRHNDCYYKSNRKRCILWKSLLHKYRFQPGNGWVTTTLNQYNKIGGYKSIFGEDVQFNLDLLRSGLHLYVINITLGIYCHKLERIFFNITLTS